jgi:hypothetical protein
VHVWVLVLDVWFESFDQSEVVDQVAMMENDIWIVVEQMWDGYLDWFLKVRSAAECVDLP